MEMIESEHVVALCGSQRDGSHTRQALRQVLAAAEERGVTTELIDISALDLPVFNPDRTEIGDAGALRQRVQNADAVVVGTPVYHGSYASPLKTALDYCGFDEFEETTVGLLVVSGGGFPTPALEHLRSVARALDAWVLPHEVAIPNAHDAFEEGELADENLAERVETLGMDLADYAGVESYPENTAACTVPTAD